MGDGRKSTTKTAHKEHELVKAKRPNHTESPAFGDLVHLRNKNQGKPLVPHALELLDEFGNPQGGLAVTVAPPKGRQFRSRSFAERLFILFTDPQESILGAIITAIIFVVILMSSVSFVVETLPTSLQYAAGCEMCKPLSRADATNELLVAERASYADQCKHCAPSSKPEFFIVETVSIMIFTFEYVVRVATSHSRPSPKEISISNQLRQPFTFPTNTKLRRTMLYMTEELNLVDLIAIIPFYLGLAGFTGTKLSVVRVLRFLRIFRIVKLGEFSTGMDMFIQVFRKSVIGFCILFVFTFTGTVVFGSLVYFAEQGEWDPSSGRFMRTSLYYLDPKEPSPFVSIPESFWWVLVTFATVGYGDMSPTTGWGQVLGVVTMYLGVLFLAMPLTIIGANFTEAYDVVKQRLEQQRLSEKERAAALVTLFGLHEHSAKIFFRKWRTLAKQEIRVDQVIRDTIRDVLGSRALDTKPTGAQTNDEDLAKRVRSLEKRIAAQTELIAKLMKKLDAKQE